ncbi:GNAT family N-acetyltransferase [Rhodovibrio salinarum]|uniref:GNAT family N-acetyltransferase n=1 Tax=Rhodovibrio salinarum TaxID=1087 RepID=UPI00047FF56A|nr:GNAT family N-acetyltransferase [Rhodovibrio salinarum]
MVLPGEHAAAHPLDIGEIAAGQLRLLPLGVDDVEELRAVTSDPAVTSVIPFLPEPFGLQQAEALLARTAQGRDLYLGIRAGRDGVVPEVPAGTLLGVLGVHLRGAEEIEIGYWLPGRYHGHGIAGTVAPAAAAVYARAFPDRRLIAECHPDNTASQRVLARAGFRPLGDPGQRPSRELYLYDPG